MSRVVFLAPEGVDPGTGHEGRVLVSGMVSCPLSLGVESRHREVLLCPLGWGLSLRGSVVLPLAASTRRRLGGRLAILVLEVHELILFAVCTLATAEEETPVTVWGQTAFCPSFFVLTKGGTRCKNLCSDKAAGAGNSKRTVFLCFFAQPLLSSSRKASAR